MAGHSRPKDGVASLAYVPAIHVFLVLYQQSKTWMAGMKPAVTLRGRYCELYASPEVSNMAASSASRAGLPAQTTNWKAGK
jgi:hypothetical protein